jgi:hypothetical protein
MSRFEKLEQTFDLPPLQLEEQLPAEQLMQDVDTLKTEWQQQNPEQLHDEEMDEIAHLAVEYGKTLHDLGMSVEVKHAGEIFNASSNMLKVALDARNAKMDKRLKLLKLELDRLKLDRSVPDPTHNPAHAQNVTVLDRNTLLAQIKELGTQVNK